MVTRLFQAFAAHIVFLAAVWVLGMLFTIFAPNPGSGREPGPIGAFFVMGMFIIPALMYQMMPAAIVSTLAHVGGGYFSPRIAVSAAIVLGCVLLFLAIPTRGAPGSLAVALPLYSKMILVATYAVSWLAAYWFLPAIRSFLKL